MAVKFEIEISNPITNQLVMDKKIYLLDSKKVKKAKNCIYRLHSVLSRKHPQCIVNIKLGDLWALSSLPFEMYNDFNKVEGGVISYKDYASKWLKK